MTRGVEMAKCPACGRQSGLSGVDGGQCLGCSGREGRIAGIKHALFTLVDEHRATCDGECAISLMHLGVLLDMAGIGVTEEEARKLW